MCASCWRSSPEVLLLPEKSRIRNPFRITVLWLWCGCESGWSPCSLTINWQLVWGRCLNPDGWDSLQERLRAAGGSWMDGWMDEEARNTSVCFVYFWLLLSDYFFLTLAFFFYHLSLTAKQYQSSSDWTGCPKDEEGTFCSSNLQITHLVHGNM